MHDNLEIHYDYVIYSAAQRLHRHGWLFNKIFVETCIIPKLSYIVIQLKISHLVVGTMVKPQILHCESFKTFGSSRLT